MSHTQDNISVSKRMCVEWVFSLQFDTISVNVPINRFIVMHWTQYSRTSRTIMDYTSSYNIIEYKYHGCNIMWELHFLPFIKHSQNFGKRKKTLSFIYSRINVTNSDLEWVTLTPWCHGNGLIQSIFHRYRDIIRFKQWFTIHKAYTKSCFSVSDHNNTRPDRIYTSYVV